MIKTFLWINEATDTSDQGLTYLLPLHPNWSWHGWWLNYSALRLFTNDRELNPFDRKCTWGFSVVLKQPQTLVRIEHPITHSKSSRLLRPAHKISGPSKTGFPCPAPPTLRSDSSPGDWSPVAPPLCVWAWGYLISSRSHLDRLANKFHWWSVATFAIGDE